MLHYIKLREDAGLRLCDVVGKVDTRRQENWLLVPAQALTACGGGGCTSPPPEVLDVLLHKSRELEQIPAVLASCDSILPSRSQRKLFNFKGFYLNFQKSRIPQVPNGEAWCLPLLFFPMEYETFQPGHRWLGTHITLPSSL